jgi:SAM-dependent methyltransferase
MTDVLRPTAAEALAAWAQRVQANYDQAEAMREGSPPSDFYAPMASAFRADPHRQDEPALNALRALVVPGETWLDIGAGGGRYALPLALAAAPGKVVAIEPSDGMLGVLRDGMAEHGIANVDIVQSRWPMDDPPRGEVAFMSHVGYDIAAIGPFLDAMEAAATRLCVCVLLAESPAAIAATAWPAVHGVERNLLPSLREFIAVIIARGNLPEVRLAGARPPASYHTVDDAHRFFRAQAFIAEGGEKDRKLRAWLEERQQADETVRITSTPQPIGIVTWAPGG